MSQARRDLKYWFIYMTLIVQQISRTYSAACEPIEIPMCRSMAYNKTRMPNLLHHSTQENAKLAIEQFDQLLETNCSDYLLFFLCSMYAPICTVDFQTDAIQPCKSVCEHARDGCLPIMLEHNVQWPDYLACEDLPVYDRGVCISPEAIVTTAPIEDGTEKPDPGAGVCDNCRKKTKTSKSNYVKNKYEFAVHVEVLSFHGERSGDLVGTRVNVKNVIKESTVPITTGEMDLWTNSSCVCPEVAKEKEYMIAGHEDKDNGRLMLLPNSLVEDWKEKYVKSIKKWEKKLQKALKKNSGKRRRGGSGKKRKNSPKPPETVTVPVDEPVPEPNNNEGGASNGGGDSGGSSGTRRKNKNRNKQRRRTKKPEE
ncbi:secreted frizzled-related protein 3-like isoform X2 [Glandiceps talaboti]